MIGQAYGQFKIGNRVRIKNLKCNVLSRFYKEGDECIIIRIYKDNEHYAVFNDENERYVGGNLCDIELVEDDLSLQKEEMDRYMKFLEENIDSLDMILWRESRLPKEEHDEVNNPLHYNQGDIECIEAQKAALSAEEFRGYLKGQVMKYTWRMGLKGKVLVDAQKAKYYQDKLVEFLKEDVS